jgi:cytochrome c556
MLNYLPIPLIVLSFVLLLGACSDKAKDTHPQQLVTKRQAIFKKMTKTLEPMGLVARERESYNKGEFQAWAQELQDLSSQPWAFFTADGNYPPTRSKPEVWQQVGEFKQAQNSYLGKVDQLVRVSGSADLAVIRSAVDEVEKSCKRCHQQFRNER